MVQGCSVFHSLRSGLELMVVNAWDFNETMKRPNSVVPEYSFKFQEEHEQALFLTFLCFKSILTQIDSSSQVNIIL